MPIITTMTGSWFRTPEINELLLQSPTGEISLEKKDAIEAAERSAIRDQVHPGGSKRGLNWVSNGEQRKSGYTYYLPNRFEGFSKTEKAGMPFTPSLGQEFQESNPQFAQLMASGQLKGFELPKIESKLRYRGAQLAKKEAEDAVRLAKQEGAERVFVPAPSPGVTTIFFPKGNAYRDHYEYLFDVGKELRKEYEAILSVDGVDLQLDSPDLAMGKQTGSWGVDFYEALPHHVDAINEATAGLPRDRIRVHYCYGNWVGSHRFDADYARVLPEFLRLKVGTIVGEMANPRHEGDAIVLEEHLKEHEWPKGLRLAAGVIDVKTPIVETPETVAARLERLAAIDKLGPNRILGGTDCGFETFANMGNVTRLVGLQKLEALASGAALASRRVGAA
jgi:5-methyltetrahydropteroyltriglutamate--homocysteine methyltransferase